MIHKSARRSGADDPASVHPADAASGVTPSCTDKSPRRRFSSPSREDVQRGTFDHPAFAELGNHREFLAGAAWPEIDELQNAATRVDLPYRFVRQTPELLRDGLHYEVRIRERHQIATRPRNWHDLLNALIWLRYPQIKQALNVRQVNDIARVGTRERTRGQCALTLFDEGGAVVILRSGPLLDAWDRHDWPLLFGDAVDWQHDSRVIIFGHALLEQLLEPHRLLVAKAIVVSTREDPHDEGLCARALTLVAEAISSEALLTDPQELRPLPVSGLPGWHDPHAAVGPARCKFLRTAECFRPLPAGRRYPAPLRLPQRGD